VTRADRVSRSSRLEELCECEQKFQHGVTELTSATPPAMIMPRADPETAFTEAAPVTYEIGLPVGDGGTFTPVDATTGLAEEVEQGTVT
jgi:hypothetical protein